jgi:hypothetical protein
VELGGYIVVSSPGGGASRRLDRTSRPTHNDLRTAEKYLAKKLVGLKNVSWCIYSVKRNKTKRCFYGNGITDHYD